ncbi:MAG: tRNA uridine-5-carboxymethylaminomethyl(34) synthesis GTPase MnmE [Zoogloeaceae bacterium]|nr:tRNA uridine-5-carboxymethylaminomethyl(34) synthesis GTPase MnmE [Zoogloeaceae bacterium]
MASRKPVDLIAAVATAPGRGGIGIVRLSGTDLAPFAQRLTGYFPQPRVAALTRFLDAAGGEIDAGILLYFPAPHSYTGEDVLELQGHGGPVVMQLLLHRCLELGARLAEPGEFTRRAYLNGKLDLAQAEAVADLIEASTAAAARSATRSLSGEFSRTVHELVDRLTGLRARVEATLDFPEEEADFLHQADPAGALRGLIEDARRLLRGARQGSVLRNGLHVVLAGQPNVGKSSLLNRLAGEERAIVTAVPGTTRDALRETIQISGIPLHVVDTAGLRETGDEVERLGVARSWKEIGQADVVLHLVDARVGMSAADRSIATRFPAGVERLVLYNKADLAAHPGSREETEGRIGLWLSAKTGEGMAALEGELLRIAGWQAGAEDVFLARERHLRALESALTHLQAARDRLDRLELCAEELRLAQEALSGITGDFTPDDLLGEIFSRFCIGK